jgi:hypothetical protein
MRDDVRRQTHASHLGEGGRRQLRLGRREACGARARRTGRALTVKDDLKSGDTARTGADGRVEILLNPGSYLRAGSRPSSSLPTPSLDDLRLSSRAGALSSRRRATTTPNSTSRSPRRARASSIVRTGVYRIDARTDGRDGRLRAEGARARRRRPRRWSRAARWRASGAGRRRGREAREEEPRRARPLEPRARQGAGEGQRRARSRQTNSLLASNGFSDLFKADYPSSYLGFWMWSTQTGCYTFLPFNAGWRSPYGYGYGSVFLVRLLQLLRAVHAAISPTSSRALIHACEQWDVFGGVPPPSSSVAAAAARAAARPSAAAEAATAAAGL